MLIAVIVLFFEFKLIPLVLQKSRLGQPKMISPLQKAEKAKFELISVLRETGLKDVLGPFTKEEINGMEIVIRVNDQLLKVLFSTEREPRAQLTSLQLILKESKIIESFNDGKPPKLIDLSSDKPYVSF